MPEELGVVLPHEHLFVSTLGPNLAEADEPETAQLARHPVDLSIRGWLEYNWHRNADNLVLDDEECATLEVARFKAAGGGTIVDVTPRGLGSQPAALKRVSQATGVHVVMGCGYYVDSTHPPELASMGPDAIAAQIISDFEKGLSTGVRAGVIGEIGCSWPITEAETLVLRGAAAAQRTLGAALYIHPGRHPDAPRQILRILREENADITRVVICHIERTIDAVGLLELANEGCYLEFDLFGMETTGSYYRELGIRIPSDGERLDLIRALSDRGHLEQVLISHDICFKHRLASYGGHGYDHILTNTITWMPALGFTEDDIRTITTDNPRNLLTLRAGNAPDKAPQEDLVT
jgi:phosphotriesterase-related protein